MKDAPHQEGRSAGQNRAQARPRRLTQCGSMFPDAQRAFLPTAGFPFPLPHPVHPFSDAEVSSIMLAVPENKNECVGSLGHNDARSLTHSAFSLAVSTQESTTHAHRSHALGTHPHVMG